MWGLIISVINLYLIVLLAILLKSGVLSEQLRGAKELLRELKNIGFEAEKIDNYGCYCKFKKEDRFGGEILTSDFSVVPKVRFIFNKKNS